MNTSANKTCLIGPAIAPEQFIAEHLFFYLVKGTVSGYYGGKHYVLESGECGVVRKNRLGRQSSLKKNDVVEKIIFVFDLPFLKAFQEKHQLHPVKFPDTESFIRTKPNNLVAGFIQSLTPYYNTRGEMDKAFFDVKREELLLILLQLQPELADVFFDYGIPGKINLEEFMNRNYKFNVSLQRFAYLTGRSLSAFKRDFRAIFNDTPNRWLVQKRLQEAYFLIGEKNKKASEVYLELGFEALSHFSFAFKKQFGVTATELGEGSRDQ